MHRRLRKTFGSDWLNLLFLHCTLYEFHTLLYSFSLFRSSFLGRFVPKQIKFVHDQTQTRMVIPTFLPSLSFFPPPFFFSIFLSRRTRCYRGTRYADGQCFRCLHLDTWLNGERSSAYKIIISRVYSLVNRANDLPSNRSPPLFDPSAIGKFRFRPRVGPASPSSCKPCLSPSLKFDSRSSGEKEY